MASTILLPRDIDVTKISFGAAKQMNGGARVVPVSYDGKTFIFQTARMTCNYGLSKWGEGPAAKYSLDGSFKDKENNKSLSNFYDFLSNLDKYMVKSGVTNSVEWFKKKTSSEEVVDALYTHTLRYSKDKNTGEINHQYPPTFKMNIPVQDGKIAVDVYDGKGNKIIITEENAQQLKGATISAIIKCTGVWLAAGNCGLTFRVAQLRVEAMRAGLSGFAFKDDDETICEEDDNSSEMHGEAPVAKSCLVDTSDEEDEQQEQIETNNTEDHVDATEDDGIDPPVKPAAKKRSGRK